MANRSKFRFASLLVLLIPLVSFGQDTPPQHAVTQQDDDWFFDFGIFDDAAGDAKFKTRFTDYWEDGSGWPPQNSHVDDKFSLLKVMGRQIALKYEVVFEDDSLVLNESQEQDPAWVRVEKCWENEVIQASDGPGRFWELYYLASRARSRTSYASYQILWHLITHPRIPNELAPKVADLLARNFPKKLSPMSVGRDGVQGGTIVAEIELVRAYGTAANNAVFQLNNEFAAFDWIGALYRYWMKEGLPEDARLQAFEELSRVIQMKDGQGIELFGIVADFEETERSQDISARQFYRHYPDRDGAKRYGDLDVVEEFNRLRAEIFGR